MGSQFLIEADLEFHGNFDEISAQADAALQKVARSAAEAEAATPGSARATTAREVGRVATGLATTAAREGFNPQQLRALDQILQNHVRGLKQAVPSYTAPTPSVSRRASNVARTVQDAQNQEVREFVQRETEERRRNARGARGLTNYDPYLKANTDAVTENARLSAAKNAGLNNPATLGALGEDAIQKARLAAAEAQALLGNDEYLKATAADAVAKKQLAASEQAATQANAGYVDAVRLTIAASKERAAIEAQASASQRNITNDALAQVANRRAKVNTAAAVTSLTTPQDIENEGIAKAASARQQLAVNLAALNARTAEDTQAEAQLIVLKKQQADQLAAQIAELQGRKPTLFQNLRHSFRANTGGTGGRTAADEQTFGKFLGQHVTNTLGYAIPGIAIGIGFTELERSVKEAEQAQRDIAEVKAEFEALGQSDQFSGFAGSIKTVSNATGLAVTEVAELALAMKGVFGDTNQATIALNGIATAAVAMDLSLKEAQTDLTAISQAFTDLQSKGGSSIGQISNELLHLQDLTGVASKTLAPGVADAAPSANQVGIGFNQTASIIAAASQRSGLDPQVIGQTFSKLIDGVSQNLQEIFSVYQQIPQLAGELPKLAKEAPAQQIPQILQDYTKLNPGEQIAIQRTLGINASAVPALNALTQSGQKAATIGASPAPADRTRQEFEKQINTLEGHFQRLQQAAANFGVAIINSGVGKALGEMASAAGVLLHVLTDLNSTTHGLLGVALAVGGAFLAWKIASGLLSSIGSLASAFKNLWAQITASTTATAANSTAEGINAASATADAAAQGTLAAADTAVAGAGALGAGERALGSGLILPAGVAAGEGEAAAAGRGLFGIGALGGGVGAGGLGAIGGGVGLGGVLLAGLAGFAAFKGTTGILDSIFGKPTSVKPSTHLTSEPADWIKANQDRIDAVAATASASQGALLEKYAKKGDVNDFYPLYNQLTASGAGKVAATDTTASQGRELDVYAAKHHETLQQVLAARHASNAQVDLLAKQSQIELTDWAGIQTGYQAGTQSFSTLLSAAQQNVTAAQQAYNAQGTGGTQAEFEALQTAIQQKNAILDQQAQQAQQFFASVQKQGSTQADIAVIGSLTSEKQLSPQGKLSQAQAIVQAYQQELQDEANLATSTAQRNAILQRGIQVSAADLAVINKDRAANGLSALKSLTIPGQQITPTQQFQGAQEAIQASQSLAQAAAFEDPVKIAQAAIQSGQQQMQAYLAAGGKATDPQFLQLAAGVKNASNQLIDANNAIVTAQINLSKAYATASGDVVGQAQQDQALAVQAFASAHGAAEQLAAQAQLVAANREVEQAVAQVASAQVNLAKAYATAGGDAVAQAADDQQLAEIALGVARGPVQQLQAQAQLVAANRELEVALAGNATAQYNLAKAYDTATGNLLAEAYDDEALANVAIGVARGAVAKLQAQAQKVAADREVITAINQIATAQAGLVTAMANATGDPAQIIAAAQHAAAVDLQSAQRIAAADAALGKNPNSDQAYTQALTQYYNDRATVANTVAQQTINETETLLFLGKETATQAIAALEAALPQVAGNVQATNQILTEIRQIQNSAGANLNFDLPTTLLPSTLYEARRLESNGTQITNGGPVTVNINVNGGSASSVSNAVSKLTAAVGGPQRTGTAGPLLNG